MKALRAIGRFVVAVLLTTGYLFGTLTGVATIWLGLVLLKLGMPAAGVQINVLVTVRTMLSDLRKQLSHLDD